MSKRRKRAAAPARAAAAPPRPETREVAVAHVTDKYSEYPSNGLTPVRLAEILYHLHKPHRGAAQEEPQGAAR